MSTPAPPYPANQSATGFEQEAARDGGGFFHIASPSWVMPLLELGAPAARPSFFLAGYFVNSASGPEAKCHNVRATVAIGWKADVLVSGPAFPRFPQWMWRNVEVANFVDWLRARNAALHPDEQAGFFGLDIYNMNASISAVIDYLERFDPEAAEVARVRYGCLTPWQRDPATYGRAALTTGYARCEAPVLLALRDLLLKQLQYEAQDRDNFLDAVQNARLIASAERYYRAMYYATAESWNLRDRHMFETLNHLMDWRGKTAKAVVWAHNSHVGNAAATDMGKARDEINIGQLCREKFACGATLIGFGTDHGTVAAADDWDGPMKIKTVRPAHLESYERLCLNSGVRRFLVDLRVGHRKLLREALMHARLERAIGVIYRPETELASHHFEARLPQQFDGYVWFDETRAVTPLPTEAKGGRRRLIRSGCRATRLQSEQQNCRPAESKASHFLMQSCQATARPRTSASGILHTVTDRGWHFQIGGSWSRVVTDSSQLILLGDIGGTNARFALLRSGKTTPITTLKVSDYADVRTSPQHWRPSISTGKS